MHTIELYKTMLSVVKQYDLVYHVKIVKADIIESVNKFRFIDDQGNEFSVAYTED